MRTAILIVAAVGAVAVYVFASGTHHELRNRYLDWRDGMPVPPIPPDYDPGESAQRRVGPVSYLPELGQGRGPLGWMANRPEDAGELRFSVWDA